MVQFRNILLSGKHRCGEGYQATAGVFGVDAPQSGVRIDTDTESGSFTLDAVSPVDGLGAYAMGFDNFQFFRNQTVPQGKHTYNVWPDDLMSGWKYDFEAVNVGEIGLQVQGPGTSDVAVALLYDLNGDGLFNMLDNREALVYLDDQWEGGEDLWYGGDGGIPFVANGRYRVVVYGNRIIPGDQYNMKLTLRGGDSLSIEGSGPWNKYTLDTYAGQKVELTVNYTVPGPGLWSGALWFGMPNEQGGWQGPEIFVPVFINKEGVLPSITKEVSHYLVHWGDIVTYTIRISNAGAEKVGMEVTDMLPPGIALLTDSLSSTLKGEHPNYWDQYECNMEYDQWMRTIHYNCALGGDYVEDTITFQARVVAQPDTFIQNKADLKWYYWDWPGQVPDSFLYDYDTGIYVPKAYIYAPIIKHIYIPFPPPIYP